MSGGSWDYAGLKVMECSEALLEDRTLGDEALSLTDDQRRARHSFGHLLAKIAMAMKAVEWVDSGDSSTPADVDAIYEVLR